MIKLFESLSPSCVYRGGEYQTNARDRTQCPAEYRRDELIIIVDNCELTVKLAIRNFANADPDVDILTELRRDSQNPAHTSARENVG